MGVRRMRGVPVGRSAGKGRCQEKASPPVRRQDIEDIISPGDIGIEICPWGSSVIVGGIDAMVVGRPCVVRGAKCHLNELQSGAGFRATLNTLAKEYFNRAHWQHTHIKVELSRARDKQHVNKGLYQQIKRLTCAPLHHNQRCPTTKGMIIAEGSAPQRMRRSRLTSLRVKQADQNSKEDIVFNRLWDWLEMTGNTMRLDTSIHSHFDKMMARKYTNRYLDTSRTLKKQDKLTVTFLLAYAQRKHQFLAKFRNNWPLHNFLGCYLRNHTQYTKKQHPNLDDSEIDESDVSDGEIDNMLNDDEDALTPSPTLQQKRHRHTHDSDDSDIDEERRPRPRKKINSAYVSIPARAKPTPASHITPAPCAPPGPKSKMTSKSSPTTTTHPGPPPATKPKPRPISASNSHTTAAKPKAKPISLPHDSHAKTTSKPADKDDAYEFADLPLVCPSEGCKDLVLADPTVELVKQLQQWDSFKSTNCCLTSEGLKSNSEQEFAKLAITSQPRMPAIISNHACPGYYGEKGKTIIQSAIFSMFDHKQISNEAFAPLDFKTYIEYYLIPWVTMHLISKDLRCSLEAAYEDMIASADSGVALHPMGEEDAHIERITRQHCVLAAERRVEKVERFRKEMNIQIEKGREEQRIHDELAAKILSKSSAQIVGQHTQKVLTASESQPVAGPSKFSGSYDDVAYQDNGESELSELDSPKSIQAQAVPPKYSRS
ncbi:hypothetical protein EDD22DRAFT_845666 [Suillus occidentalis]|nr:hypothetical protein EDD22DRAFT_845666 [Suillus occidentalis]